MNNNRFLSLYSCCQLVAGAKRALLLDTQREKYYLVPLGLKELIEAANGRELPHVLDELSDEEREIAAEYINFLINQECAFYCDSAEEAACFPSMDLHWDFPAAITNAIIEINGEQQISDIHRFLQSHFIPCLEIALHFPIRSIVQLDTVIKLFSSLNTKGLRILFQDNGLVDLPGLRQLSIQNPVIELLAIFGAPKYQIESESGTTILFTPQLDFSLAHCGIIGKEYFNLSLNHFLESQAYNSCLNRKISIDKDGNIKNCPAMKETYGNVNSTSLDVLLNQPEFTRSWKVSKDQISVCKDCEFRYICTDCRAYLENPQDLYSKPLKCGYDPYTNTWEDWSINPLKQSTIIHYGLNE